MVANNEARPVFDAAMKLSPEAQAALLDMLLFETSDGNDEEVTQSWAQEAERRIDAVEAGTEELLDGDEIISALRAGRRP